MCGSVSATSINCSEDTYISSGDANTNFGDSTVLSTMDTSGTDNNTYVKFTVSNYSSESILWMYQTYGGTHTVYAYETTTDWDEDVMTWNTGRPSDEGSVATNTTTTVGAGWVAFDVSDVVTQPGTYSFRIQAQYGYVYTFDSKEASNVPYLEITETEPQYEYYVNSSHPSASDSNNGTVDYPYLTIGKGIETAIDGATVYVIGGTDYEEELSIISNNITIQGVSNPNLESTGDAIEIGSGTYHPTNITISGFSVNASDNALNFPTDSNVTDVTIDNCTLNSTNTVVSIRPSSGLNGLDIYNSYLNAITSGSGIYAFEDSSVTTGANNVTVIGCEIYSHGTQYAGIKFTKNTGNDFRVEDTYFSTVWDCIRYDNSEEQGYPRPKNIWIENNTLYAYSSGGYSGTNLDIVFADNVTTRNNSMMWSGYTGLKLIGCDGVDSFGDIVYGNYGHNAMEPKGTNATYSNLKVYGVNTSMGDSWNVFYTAAGTQQDHYITVQDIYANDTEGRLIGYGGHQDHIIYRNITSVNHDGVSIYSFGYGEELYDYITSDKIVVDNATIENNGNTYNDVILLSLGTSNGNDTDYENYTRDVQNYIDINLTGTNSNSAWFITNKGDLNICTGDVYLINLNDVTSRWEFYEPDRCDTVLHEMYYGHIKVVDNAGNPINNAALTFSANTTNPETSATLKPHNVDYADTYYTGELDVAYTNSNGLTDTRYENVSNCVALTAGMQYWDSAADTELYQAVEWNVTATYNGTSNSTIITPDMLRYSPDSADIQSDLVSIVLDVDITEYWTPTPGTHYIGVPETHSWIGGEWVVTYSGTYTEPQTEITGVEIRP
jgi:hypothetical protein